LRAAHDLGLRVPRDVALVTIDGAVQTAYTSPRLTAVQVPWRDMFMLATRFLLEMIEGAPCPCGSSAPGSVASWWCVNRRQARQPHVAAAIVANLH
jgi:DNA-binding LacI/PurR family transcriptional regulator